MEREGHGFSRAARVTDFGFSRQGTSFIKRTYRSSPVTIPDLKARS
jgi:hypothetical protein